MILTIKKKWFDMIVSGEKKEEYRAVKQYYTSRLARLWCENYLGKKYTGINAQKDFILWLKDNKSILLGELILRNGYSKNSPHITVKCNLSIGKGKKEWGAVEGKEYYVFEIKETGR